MSIKVFITIDAEEDQWDGWERGGSVENIQRIFLIQELFDRFGAIPTYLVTYQVAIDDSSSRLFKEISGNGRCEIGAHCHPWNMPPFEEIITGRNTLLCNLPFELQYRSIEKLHETIIDRIGVNPTCFRAGRWGFSPSVAKSIHKLGYKVDTSVTPFWDWTDENGPDFSYASTFPYRFNPDDVFRKEANGCILEIPVSVGFLQKDFKKSALIRKKIAKGLFSKCRLLGILDKLKIINIRWLSPEVSSGSDMVHLARTLIRTGHSFLNLTFHSTTLLPGRTPFVKNERELRKFITKIETFLEFAVDNHFIFLPLNAATELFEDKHKIMEDEETRD